MSYLELSDGVPLHYEDVGAGSPIVFVPGWTMTTAMWRKQVPFFEADHRVVTLDLRGAGRSGKTSDRHSLADYAGDVGELVDTLGLEDVTLVAWAMGVSVSVHLLTQVGTDRVGRFVWIDHSPSFLNEPGWDYSLGSDFTVADLDAMCEAQMSARAAAIDELLGLMFFHPLSEEDRRCYYRDIYQTPAEVASRMLREVATTDLRPMIDRVRVPTLVVNGVESVVPVAVCEWIAAHLPDGRCATIADAGHAPFWDNAESFNETVAEFLVVR